MANPRMKQQMESLLITGESEFSKDDLLRISQSLDNQVKNTLSAKADVTQENTRSFRR